MWLSVTPQKLTQCGLNAELTNDLSTSYSVTKGKKNGAHTAAPEAVFVSMVDNLDAKMGMVQRVLRNSPEGEVFSEFLPGLQTRILLTPPQK